MVQVVDFKAGEGVFISAGMGGMRLGANREGIKWGEIRGE